MKLSLQNKISMFLTLTVFAIGTICAYLFISAYTVSKEKELIARGTTLSYSLSRTAEEGLIREDLDLLQKASYIVRAEDVVSVQVYSNIWDSVDAYPIERLKSPPHAEAVKHFEGSSSPLYIKLKDGYDFYNPVLFYASGNSPQVTIGFARVVLSSLGMQKEMKQLLAFIIGAAIGITLMAVAALHALIGRLVLNPITKIYEYVSRVKSGDLPAADAHKEMPETGTQELDTISMVVSEAFKKLDKKTEQYQALHSIAVSLHEYFSPDEMLNLIIDRAGQLINVELAAIALYDDKGKFKKLITRGTTIKTGDALPEGKGVLELTRLSLTPVRIDNVSEHPAFSGSFPEGHPIIRNLLAYPIFSDEGKPIGALYFGNKSEGFSDDDESILKAISADTAIALNKAESLMQLRRFQQVIDSAFDVILVTDSAGYITHVNPAFETVTEYSAKEVIGKKTNILKSGYHDNDFYKNLWDTIKAGDVWKGEFINRKKNGEIYYTSAVIFPIQAEGEVYYAAIQRDITQEKKLYEQLIRSQKMEAIGTLAGGIAHDFNNLLTAMLGYSEIMLGMTKEGDPFYRPATIINNAAQKGADLAKKILMVTRKEKMETKAVDINEIIHNSMELLQRSIPKNIEIKLNLKENIPNIVADPSQMHQVIMNLAVNARDAMPEGGRLTIETSVVGAENGAANGISTDKDGFIKLSVSDTGTGMDTETQSRIFDPFFTTKESGKGTGLGLYIVHSIINNHSGYINIYSELDKGTRFNIYLPIAKGIDKEESIVDEDITGTGTILVIDDESDIRELCRDILQPLGYEVVLARNGSEGINTFRAMKDAVSLVIVDMIMPKMGGGEVFQTLRTMKSDVNILLSVRATATTVFPA
ncbi:MAG: ATP-binding protein [Nitrospirae bacterium]|nr:ATP-binding protein [Nitrospirota bacterium]MCL5978425.1 ATP-binding protein [Nitrospirota bacterium]